MLGLMSSSVLTCQFRRQDYFMMRTNEPLRALISLTEFRFATLTSLPLAATVNKAAGS